MSAVDSIAPPESDAGSAPYWQSLREHELKVQACEACDRRRFPVTPACPYCADPRFRWEVPSGAATVYSYIVIHRTFDPAFEGEVPYTVATLDLEGGGRIVARMDRTPEVGDKVRAVYVDHAEWSELRFEAAV